MPPSRAEAKAPPKLSAHGQPLSLSVVTTLFVHLLLLDRYQQLFSYIASWMLHLGKCWQV